MKKIAYVLAAMLMSVSAWAQEPAEIKLWPQGAPNPNGLTGPENVMENGRVGNITDPVIYVYKADAVKNTGAAVIICPGGGYVRLAMNHEGHDVARWLAANGITGIVLKYRMPNGHHDVPLSDAHQAIRIVRQRAGEWGVDARKVGIAGNSAGGHLAATAATHFDAATRPDFAVIFYGVISFDPAISHAGSGRGLLGENATAELRDLYSNEKQVTTDTPPTLLFHSNDDRTVPVQNSLAFFEAMKQNNVKGALYVFPTGGHGWGFTPSFPFHEEWKSLMLKWLDAMKMTAE
jgi:acetyl esterase/lipase